MYFIGIDIGTGSTKAIAVDPSGKVLMSSQVPYPTLSPQPGISEQSPEIIWQAFIKGIIRITSTLIEKPEAICLSSAMHSVIPVDEYGKPLSNMITWADNRSATVASSLRNSPEGKLIYEQTGTPIHAMSPLCKIMWLRENDEKLFHAAKRFISIKEYIWHKLFNVFEVDYSIASATGLFNIISLCWHEKALELARITTENLSKPVNTTFFRAGIGAGLAEMLRLPPDIPFMIGASDGCLANVGSLATTPGIAALTIGTSGAIRVASTEPAINWEQMTFNYRLDENIFISGGPINNGGVALKWYAQNLLGKKLDTQDAYAELLQTLPHVPPGAEGLIFLPYILGERAPIWNSDSCGVFFGITARHKQEHFTRAVVEGIVFSLYQIGKGIEYQGNTITQIHVSGGFVHSEHWVRILANVFGKKVVLVNQEDASAIGAAFLGFRERNIEGDYANTDMHTSVTFEPDEETHAFYRDKIHPLYEHLYAALVLEMKIRQDLSLNPWPEKQPTS